MKMTVIVLSTSPFRFTNKMGEVISGVNFFYLLNDNLSPTEEDEQGRKGTDPQQGKLPYDFKEEFKEVPGIYDVEIAMKTTAQNMGGTMTIKGIKYKKGITQDIS